MEKRQDAETDGEGKRMNCLFTGNTQRHERLAEHVCQQRLPNPTEAEAREGDPELSCRKISVEMLYYILCKNRPPMPRLDSLGYLRRANFDDGKFCCDEETIGEDKPQNEYDIADNLGQHSGFACRDE